MKPQFLADADLDRRILLATRRQEAGIDVQEATAAGLPGLDDPAVLTVAADGARILVTHDARTMPRHFGAFIQQRESPGVLIVPQRLAISEASAALILVWTVTEAADWINRLAWLPL